jgi:polysaccharide export outer membrane protein
MSTHARSIVSAVLFTTTLAAAASAQTPAPAVAKPASPAAAPPTANGVTPPADYIIGPDDQLSVLFWRDKDMSADVIVRPDGKITLPLLNEMVAAGLTPEELRLKVTEEAKRFVEDPNATIVVRQINSRKVFITGQVEKTGPYPLSGPTTVLQLISMAGGLKEYAESKKIVIMRTENGKQLSFTFNYREVIERKNLKQNIELKPGDTVIVP